MPTRPERRSVDLSGYPGLVVVYLGTRVTRLQGVLSIMGLGQGIAASVASRPEGLLLHEGLLFGWRHVGMRQYWRNLESLEAFTRSGPHRTWWKDFLRDDRGTGFWHETYRMSGGMEAIYLGMPSPVGFARFAPGCHPEGPFMTARDRLLGQGAG